MKNYTAVKTRQKALDIINEWASKTANHNPWIDDVVVHCDCGETQGFRSDVQDKNGNEHTAIVCYCDSCGDDDAFLNEVLHIS